MIMKNKKKFHRQRLFEFAKISKVKITITTISTISIVTIKLKITITIEIDITINISITISLSQSPVHKGNITTKQIQLIRQQYLNNLYLSVCDYYICLICLLFIFTEEIQANLEKWNIYFIMVLQKINEMCIEKSFNEIYMIVIKFFSFNWIWTIIPYSIEKFDPIDTKKEIDEVDALELLDILFFIFCYNHILIHSYLIQNK
ncbi:hypothetical protein RFI_26417 [Reticulomyxa filosa]|uniref:Transmembrane protein n=1 Tax=Reticulomyxa filosa TaxID=46433 RepID=X6MAT6_RETFI|nr:hypothetical protein RFI_26417 [Reticulomyxa filosa]|eukprot:ETO10959.1 hypothetical protein RFI_26417 [Reticulomyxa filosa]